MNQNVLWHDTIYDAIGADIAAAGGFKSVAGKLWPSESPSTAATKLRNAINPDQAQKLCPEEVLRIKQLAKEAGSFATVQYEARELAFDFSWIQPEDELTRLQRRATDLMEQLQRELKRSNELMSQSKQLRAVK
jgi:hypothetical protein